MILLLDETASVSSIFGVGNTEWFFFLKSAGGDWVLEYRDPDGVWTVVSENYSATGMFRYPSYPGAVFRFRGGTVGAKIWGSGVYV